MNYLSADEMAKKWGLTSRSVRSYCAQGRIEGAIQKDRRWLIPEGTSRPKRRNARASLLIARLQDEQKHKIKDGIYQYVQVAFAYNSNHIEGSQLSPEQTMMLYATSTVIPGNISISFDDIVEAKNHFRAFDYVLGHVSAALTERLVKNVHKILKTGTNEANLGWFSVGDYKKLPNVVGGRETASPSEVKKLMAKLLDDYDKWHAKTQRGHPEAGSEKRQAEVAFRRLHDEDAKASTPNKRQLVTSQAQRIQNPEEVLHNLLDFHVRFERIHPFQDGNGRVGRLLLFKECLRHGIVPFIIEDDKKWFYYRGLSEWDTEPGYLMGTAQAAQDAFIKQLNYFEIDTPSY